MALARTFETYRLPLKATTTATIAPGATSTVTLTVPEADLYFLKTVTTAVGATSSITDISVDGVSTGELTTFDTQNVFGAIISAWNTITMTVTNAGTTGEDATLSVVGYYSIQ